MRNEPDRLIEEDIERNSACDHIYGVHRIIREVDAIRIAEANNVTIAEVFRAALKAEIVPYRYIRNGGTISVSEQLTLAESVVAIIGLGGLGGGVAMALARIGIGTLIVVDDGVFDETNLNRQALCTSGTLGMAKTDVAVVAIGEINPAVDVIPYRQRFTEATARTHIRGAAVVVDALDNIGTRVELERAAKALRIPFVHGAVAGLEGVVMTVFPEDTGIRNHYGENFTTEGSDESPEALYGVPVISPFAIGALQVAEVVKILLGRGKLARNRIVHADLENARFIDLGFDD